MKQFIHEIDGSGHHMSFIFNTKWKHNIWERKKIGHIWVFVNGLPVRLMILSPSKWKINKHVHTNKLIYYIVPS